MTGVVALAAAAAACAPERGSREAGEGREVVVFQDAASVFATLEERLLGARTLHVVSRVQATGALSASLEGGFWLQGDRMASLDFAGTFASKPVYVLLQSDGRSMSGGNDGNDFEVSAPDALRNGLVLGLTRMGILHNLAKLTSGELPDRTDGTFEGWVQVTDLRLAGEAEIDGVPARAVIFNIVVGGTPSANATLWLSVATGLPVQRNQRVSFQSGEMTVVEKYDVFDLNVPVESKRFKVKRK